MQKAYKLVYAKDVLANLPSALSKRVEKIKGCKNDDYRKCVK